MTDYPRLAARLFNTALLVTPDAAGSIANFMLSRMAGDPSPLPAREASTEPASPYTLDGDGIATIEIHGELVNRGDWMDAYSGLTSYKTIVAALDAASADPKVRGVVLDIDSPGGEASGAMETAAAIRALSARKRVVAYVDSLAASAAYALAAGADEIVAMPSATLGSIGVVWMHLDRSAAMAKKGVTPTLLHAGTYKVDGHPFAALPDAARGRIQSRIDGMYGLFLASVGAHRPKLGIEGARATQAGVFMGAQAVEAGLADRVGGLSAVKSSFPRKPLWSLKMSAEPLHTQEALEAALASARRESTTALASAVAQATAAERTRIAAILDAPAAAGRETQARHIAFKTAMTPVDALAMLEVAPAAAAPAAPAATPFARAMETLDSPRLGPSGGPAAPAPRGVDTAGIYAARAAAQGRR